MARGRVSYLYAIVAVILWGTMSPVNKFILGFCSEMELLFLSTFLAALFSLAVLILTGRFHMLLELRISDYLTIAGLGTIGTFLYSMCYNYGIHRLASQEACIINYMWPVMVIVFSCLILKEKMTLRKIAAILVSFLGVVVIVTKLNFANIQIESMSGVTACLMAAILYGIFCALNKKRSYDQYISMFIFNGVAAIYSLAIMTLRHDFAIPKEKLVVLSLLWIGLFTTGLAYLLWNLALVGGETSKISNIAYLTPFLSILFSKIILNEPISPYSFFGLILILLGICIQMGERENGVKPDIERT